MTLPRIESSEVFDCKLGPVNLESNIEKSGLSKTRKNRPRDAESFESTISGISCLSEISGLSEISENTNRIFSQYRGRSRSYL